DRERYPISQESLPIVVEAVRSHLSCFSEINDHLDPFVPTLDAAGAARRGALREDAAAQAVLRAARERLSSLPAWDDSAIDAAVREVGAAVGARGRALFEPLRIALTGAEHGPPLAKVAA